MCDVSDYFYDKEKSFSRPSGLPYLFRSKVSTIWATKGDILLYPYSEETNITNFELRFSHYQLKVHEFFWQYSGALILLKLNH